jgi:hypothetical protein
MLCFQHLLRGVECFYLTGENITKTEDSLYRVEVSTAKNHPKGFEFCVHVNLAHPSRMGVFLEDYISLMGSVPGSSTSFFACKLAKGRTRGALLRAVPTERLSSLTIRNACKELIENSGMEGLWRL